MRFMKGLKNEFETAVVNRPYVLRLFFQVSVESKDTSQVVVVRHVLRHQKIQHLRISNMFFCSNYVTYDPILAHMGGFV